MRTEYIQAAARCDMLEITSSVDGTGTFPDGSLNVRRLVLALDDSAPTEETALDIEYQNVIIGGNCSATGDEYVPQGPFNFVAMHMSEWVTEDGESWEGLIIKAWNAVPDDPSVLARKVYDRSQTVDNGGGSSTITEYTVIEIRT